MLKNKSELNFGNNGFTFVEIMVFTTIISFLFISMTSTVINSLQRMQVTEHRLYANRYAEELVEWMRSEKEGDWDTFVSHDPSEGSGTIYCFNDALDFISPNPWIPTTVNECPFDGIASTPPVIYRRYAMVTAVPPSFKQVNVQIIVEWREGNKYYSVPLNTVFTNIDENAQTPTPTP